jgi:hypothetical protein
LTRGVITRLRVCCLRDVVVMWELRERCSHAHIAILGLVGFQREPACCTAHPQLVPLQPLYLTRTAHTRRANTSQHVNPTFEHACTTYHAMRSRHVELVVYKNRCSLLWLFGLGSALRRVWREIFRNDNFCWPECEIRTNGVPISKHFRNPQCGRL